MKYSVLMSIYKDEEVDYFEDSILSMLKQTLYPDEIVIVKDGPLTDQLEAVIKKYNDKYPGLFNIVPLKQNMGLGLALNKGLEASKNELVARMDTDDISLPERCEKQVEEFIKDPELVICGTNIDEFTHTPNEVVSSRVVPENHVDIVKFSKRRNPFNHPTVMYRKSAVLEAGGYGDFRRNQDYQLFVRMLTEGYKSMNLQESLLLFRANEDNVKRRKSWHKTKSEISIRHDFWKKGYIDFGSFFVTTIGFIGAFLLPNRLFEVLSNKLLRTKK